MSTYYQLLEISEQATEAEIEAAYRLRRASYAPDQVAQLGDDVRRVAEQRTAELDQAYAVLSDPARRGEYDASLHRAARPPARGGLSRREMAMAAGGALVGLLVIALVWVLSGRAAEPGLPAVGETNRPAPDFVLPALGGGDVRLSDYRGQVVLLNFWGTWCEPCKEEMPALQEVHAELGDSGLAIIGVNLYAQETGGESAVRAFLDQFGVSYVTALDTDGATARAFQISPIPVSYFIDPSGTIRYVRVGTVKAEEVRALFARLRQEASLH